MEPIKLRYRAERRDARRGALYIYGGIYGSVWDEEDVSPDKVEHELIRRLQQVAKG